LGIGGDEDQAAVPIMVAPRGEVGVVGPDVDAASGDEIMALPALGRLLKDGHQATLGRGSKLWRSGADKRCLDLTR
jgi:hypothetical protein